jgi:hypothetical protein
VTPNETGVYKVAEACVPSVYPCFVVQEMYLAEHLQSSRYFINTMCVP